MLLLRGVFMYVCYVCIYQQYYKYWLLSSKDLPRTPESLAVGKFRQSRSVCSLCFRVLLPATKTPFRQTALLCAQYRSLFGSLSLSFSLPLSVRLIVCQCLSVGVCFRLILSSSGDVFLCYFEPLSHPHTTVATLPHHTHVTATTHSLTHTLSPPSSPHTVTTQYQHNFGDARVYIDLTLSLSTSFIDFLSITPACP